MTQKVVLTQEQADAVESAKKRYGKDQFLYEFSRMLHEISPLQFTGSLGPINDLALHRVAKALYIGYEVEPKFKVGDWVHSNVTGRVAKIDDRGYGEENAWVDDEEVNFFTDFRHATSEEIAREKERRWWNSHNRDVWELNEGDVLLYLGDPYKVKWCNSHIVSFGEGATDYEESFDYVKERFIVMYFAEDRKDV